MQQGCSQPRCRRMRTVYISIDAYYPFDYPSFAMSRDDSGPHCWPFDDFGSAYLTAAAVAC